MSAQSSSMHKIIGSARSTFDRMAGTSRSLVAAARLHPAGFAVPSAVIAVAVAFVTFVTAVVLRVIPPNLFGTGSPPIIQPSTSQSRHRPHQQPVLAGPPILGPWGGSRRHGSIGSHEQGPGSDGASAMPIALSTPPTLAITSGPRLISGHNPASSSPATTPTMVSVTVGASSPVAQVSQTAAPVVGTTAATVGQAVQGVTGVVGAVTRTVGAVTSTVGAVTGTVGAVTSTVGAVTGTVGAVISPVGAVSSTVGAVAGTVGAVTNTVGVTASAAESAAPVGAQVSLGSSGSAAGGSPKPASVSGQTPTATVTVSVSDLTGNGSSQPAVSLSVSVPGLG